MHEVKHSIREARIPAGVAEGWKPEGRPAAVLLRWFATHWCNYRFPYCRQNHARRQPIDGHGAHCFDNWPVNQWLRAFQRHFQARQLSLVITGGEPLVDHAPMAELVNGLTAMPTVECIRIDKRILKEYLPSFDDGYRTGLRSLLRQACFFPAVAYQVNPWGRHHVGCHRKNEKRKKKKGQGKKDRHLFQRSASKSRSDDRQ